MYNIVKSWFSKSKTDTSVEKQNSIIFELTENDDVKIKLNFELSSDEAAHSMGIFLNELTTGQMSHSIMNIMMDLATDYPAYTNLVKKSLVIWMTEFSKASSDKNEKPVVSPTQFTNAARS